MMNSVDTTTAGTRIQTYKKGNIQYLKGTNQHYESRKTLS